MALNWLFGPKEQFAINIWLVDDRPKNRADFEERYRDEPFRPQTFSTPEELLKALDAGEPPDALLCDIYYFDDEKTREDVEAEVVRLARELKEGVARFGVDTAQRGVQLIQKVSQRRKGHRPPVIYAYTSKGSYLLEDRAFEDLAKVKAGWLFKNKYSREEERDLVENDVRDFRRANNVGRRVAQAALATGVVSAVLGAVLGVLAERLLNGRPFYVLAIVLAVAAALLIALYRRFSAE